MVFDDDHDDDNDYYCYYHSAIVLPLYNKIIAALIQNLPFDNFDGCTL